MKKKAGSIVFVGICMAMGLVPLVGMTVARTDTTTENRVLSEFPSLVTEDGSFNVSFLPDLGTYFEDHFAFRNNLVAADSLIMGKLFHQSSVDTVLVGTDGWLYYTDSLDDYLGQNVVTDRGAYNIANNLKIVQEKMDQEGINFAFTIAPNKNSLYDDNMPYYYRVKASNENNRSKVVPLLDELGINYIDLYSVFEEQDEVLYRKQDSHWNQKGAVLAYNTVLDALGKTHEDYSSSEISRIKTEKGDLATALYSIAAETEWDYRYETESSYTYVTETESWEDNWVQTESSGKTGSLLMFRDSFGNTLSPLMAGEYATAAFSKASIYHLDSRIEMCQPDTVVFEIVERNLDHFGQFSPDADSEGPPIMEAPYAAEKVYGSSLSAPAEDGHATAAAQLSDQSPDYVCISGEIDEAFIDTTSNVYVEITVDDMTNVYEAYTVTNPDTGSDDGFMMYLSSSEAPDGTFGIRVFVESEDGTITRVMDDELTYDTEVSWE